MIRLSSVFFVWLVLAFGSIFSTSANAQVLVASAIDDTQTHAWTVYKNSADEIVLVHLPPRDGDANARIPIAPALPGELRAVRALNKFPDAIAAVENRVYLVFPSVPVAERRIRRVFSGRAVGSPVGSMWGFVPNGRLDSEPAIQVDGEIIDFVATSQALWVLINEGDQYTLMTLGKKQWDEIELPKAEGASWRLSAAGSSIIAINTTSSTNIAAFVRTQVEIGWSNDWVSVPKPAGGFELIAGAHGVFIVDRNDHGLVRVQTWSGTGVYTIVPGLEIESGAEFAFLGSVNRLVGVAQLAGIEIEDEDAQQASVQVYEVDLADGSMIYSGEPTAVVPVSVAEMRFLMGMMVLIMVGVLVVVILPDNADAMGIPDGFALADPGRRLLATMFDVFLVAFVIGRLFDVQVIEIVTLSVIARSDTSWLVVPMVLISGIVTMSMLEWLFGASPGKWMMGIRVVRGQSGAMDRIPLWAAIVRNVIKWLLPPVAALALVDPEMLHRGDRVTKTLVVAPIEGYDPSQTRGDSDSEA